ncbi:hypothetical protein ACFQH6_04560 [Halobacteriaceae archaeon GCM10025711]
MTNAVIDALAELDAALAAGDYLAAREQTTELFDAYDESRPAERAFIERAKYVARSEGPIVGPEGNSRDDAVSQYLLDLQTVQLRRAGAMMALGVGFPNEISSELPTSVAQLRQSEEALEEKKEAAAPHVESISVEALPAIYSTDLQEGPYAVDEQINLSTVVGNAGDESVLDLSLHLEAPGAVDIVSDDIWSVSLMGTESESFTFDIVPRTSGTHRVTLVLQGEEELDHETVEIEVLTFEELVERATDRLESLRASITDTSTSEGAKRRLTSSVDAALDHLAKAESDIESGKQNQPGKELSAAINQLGALLNKLEANDSGSGKKTRKKTFTVSQRARYSTRTAEIIELLATARTARN